MQNGLLLGLPVVFDTHSEKIKAGDKVLLTYQGQNIATLTVDSKWMPNKPVEALECYGTSSIEHPAVQMISMERGKYYIGMLSLFCHFETLVPESSSLQSHWPHCCTSLKARAHKRCSFGGGMC